MTAARTSVLPDGRTLVIGSVDAPVLPASKETFVVLVPAFDAAERGKVEQAAPTLLAAGCIEFACVGPESERLHDALDDLLVERAALDVVTTWDTDPAEACEYFLDVAGGRPPRLVALVASHPALASALERDRD